jgi:hypothetical protein
LELPGRKGYPGAPATAIWACHRHRDQFACFIGAGAAVYAEEGTGDSKPALVEERASEYLPFSVADNDGARQIGAEAGREDRATPRFGLGAGTAKRSADRDGWGRERRRKFEDE